MHYRMKTLRVFLNIGILVLCIGCSVENDFSIGNQGEKLNGIYEEHKVDDGNDVSMIESWIGEYEFYEFHEPNINMVYNIDIFAESGEIFANIYIDGFQTQTYLKAEVIGDTEEINLIFESYLPDNSYEHYNKGDVLLSFKKNNSEIHTYWGMIAPILESNRDTGNVYFEKILD